MNKKAKYSDIIYLLFFAWLIGVTIVNYLTYNYTISINAYAGFLGWIIVIILKFRDNIKAQYGVLTLLILSVFNIICFSSESMSFGSANTFWIGSLYFNYPGIDPFILLIALIYLSINWKFIKPLYQRIFTPSDEEFINEYTRKVDFYYNKFSSYNNVEFSTVLSDIKDYPVEAQEAINKIAAQKAKYVL